MQHLIYLETSSNNPAFNLALEEVLLNSLEASSSETLFAEIAPNTPFSGYFLLWQNSPSVIIGRHQNAPSEVNLPELARRNITLIRRPTGGGAVYHDLGNLNFTFLLPQKRSKQIMPTNVLEPLLNYLKSLGLQAYMQGRNDISIALPQSSVPGAPNFATSGNSGNSGNLGNLGNLGNSGCIPSSAMPSAPANLSSPNSADATPERASAKISGLASRQLPGCYQLHGTILFDVELSLLEQVLLVDPAKYKSKGVASVKARVSNLKPYLNITLQQFWAGLKQAYQPHVAQLPQAVIMQAKSLAAIKYSQDSWNIGQSPPGDIVLKKRFAFGSLELHLATQKNYISAAKITGDFIVHTPTEPQAQNIINTLAQALVGLPANQPELWAKSWNKFDLNHIFLGHVDKQKILAWLAKGE